MQGMHRLGTEQGQDFAETVCGSQVPSLDGENLLWVAKLVDSNPLFPKGKPGIEKRGWDSRTVFCKDVPIV
eukprot:791919-Pelagomonas_calceolata.AAC.3